MIGVLFSGGKDSTLTAFIMLQQGFSVKLISFEPKNKESYMLQSVNIDKAHLVAKAMGLKHINYSVSGEKELEVEEMLNHLKKEKLDGIAAGAYKSEYQKTRIEYICHELGIPSYAPLWHRNYEKDLDEMQIILVRASAYGLNKSHLGVLWKDLPEDIKKTLLEGGEGETMVLDAPFFNKRIVLDEVEKQWNIIEGNLIIKKAHIEKKINKR